MSASFSLLFWAVLFQLTPVFGNFDWLRHWNRFLLLHTSEFLLRKLFDAIESSSSSCRTFSALDRNLFKSRRKNDTTNSLDLGWFATECRKKNPITTLSSNSRNKTQKSRMTIHSIPWRLRVGVQGYSNGISFSSEHKRVRSFAFTFALYSTSVVRFKKTQRFSVISRHRRWTAMDKLNEKQQRWKSVWPTKIIALVATVQLMLTLGIIGLEAGSIIIDIDQGTVYAGFYCSVFFIMTWISMYCVGKWRRYRNSLDFYTRYILVCCNTYSMPCAIHTLVQNVLSIGAASVIIYFDSIFMYYPGTCYFSTSTICNGLASASFTSSNTSSYLIKIACIKAQLACAATMMFTNVVYIAFFIFVAVKANRRSNGHSPGAFPPGMHPVQIPVYPNAGNVINYPPVLHPTIPNFPSYVAECPNCHIYMRVG